MKLFGYSVGVVEALIAVNFTISFFALAGVISLAEYGLMPAAFFEKPWTLITSMFLHGGIWHLFLNMFSLYFLGPYLSQLIGEKKLLEVYFIGGIVGGLLYVLLALTLGVLVSGSILSLWISGPNTIAVGASGALFALAGALAIMRPTMRVIVFPIGIPMPLSYAVFGMFILFSFIPFIAWQAHLGGLIVGVVYGMRYRKKEPFRGHMYGSYARKYGF